MKRFVLIVLSVVMLFTLIGCGKSDTEDTVGIRGEITKLTLDEQEKVIGIMVEGEIEPDTTYDKAHAAVKENTEIYEKDSIVTVDNLKEGLKVEVVFDGPVAESYPVQGVAKVIRIIE